VPYEKASGNCKSKHCRDLDSVLTRWKHVKEDAQYEKLKSKGKVHNIVAQHGLGSVMTDLLKVQSLETHHQQPRPFCYAFGLDFRLIAGGKLFKTGTRVTRHDDD